MIRPFSYFGSKHSIANYYPKPTYDAIIEPFAGSAGYSCLYAKHKIRLYDVDDNIAACWRFLINASVADCRELPLHPPYPSAAEALIGFWLANGRTTPAREPSTWMRSGERPNAYWGPVARECLAIVSQQIKHWTFEQQSYETIPTQTATWFIDPPYSSKGGRSYRHHEINYGRLAEWCSSLPGQVIVCEEEGATWLPFIPLGNFKTGRKGRIKEVIWTKSDD